MDKARLAARVLLPAFAAVAVVGGGAATASAEPVDSQNDNVLGRQLPGDLLGGSALGSNPVGNVLGNTPLGGVLGSNPVGNVLGNTPLGNALG